MELPETASPDISGVGGPNRVAKNFGNNFKNWIFLLEKLPKSAFSIFHFDKEGGAPGQKFLFDVIPID